MNNDGEHPYGDKGQLILLGLFLLFWISDSFFVKKTTFLAEYIPLWVRLVVLALSLVLAVWLIVSSHSVTDHEERMSHVISDGTFRYIRHPLYLGSLLFYFGLTCSTFSLLAILLFIVIFFFYNFIASFEEKSLEMKFGDLYVQYKKTTGKWIPRLR